MQPEKSTSVVRLPRPNPALLTAVLRRLLAEAEAELDARAAEPEQRKSA